jgi:hypothetical protein
MSQIIYVGLLVKSKILIKSSTCVGLMAIEFVSSATYDEIYVMRPSVVG